MARIASEQRRLDLINAAIEVIADCGVDGATTRMIAERAGSPLTMIHYCFGTKEELFYAVFDPATWTQYEGTLAVRPGVGLGRAAATVMRQIGTWLYDAGIRARAHSELFLWITRQDTERARKVYDATLEAVVEPLRAGLRAGDDVDLVYPLARMITAYGDGAVMQNLAFRDKTTHELCLDSIAEALERLADSRRAIAAPGLGLNPR